jgi:formylglycine-generating enzyme required for sulfatase activity
MPPPLLAFGHAALAQRIVSELVDSLQPGAGSSTEPALVVGVFGEWGAGKSRLLQSVADALQERSKGQDERNEQSLTVVVPFNAWRYEREEHLLVPLLRVAQQCLRKALEDSLAEDIRRNERLSDRLVLLGDLAQTVYQHGGRELMQTALASQGVVFKLPELKAEAGKAPPSAWARWRQRREALQQARRLALPADALHSLYYDFLEHLKAVTGRNPKALALHRERLKYRGLGWWPRLLWRVRAAAGWLGTGELPVDADFQLNLVFLVDDLDRCLPDKAVEVLEAIKLFLEVEGCAFVLALDEEVIERGIAHRYRDYALQGREGLTPITGAEYLEKLVHLPVRLPRPTGAAARDFLAERWPAWFADSTAKANDLATLVAAITPGVPRKLHRMAALLALAESLGAGDAKTPRRREWLAIVCALQLFAPALYRFLRLHGARLLITLSDWRTDALFRDVPGLRKALQRQVHGVDSPAQLQYRLVLLRLPDLCEAAMQNRSGFDLLELLARVGELHQQAALTGAQLGALMVFTEVAAGVEPPAAAVATTPDEVRSTTGLAEPEIVELQAALVAAAAPEVQPAWRQVELTPTGPLEARLENERALLEAVDSGELEVVRVALSREGAALRGRVLPMSLWAQLKQGSLRSRLHDWVSRGAPADAMQQLLVELRPLMSQVIAFDLLKEFGDPMLRVIRRPDWAHQVRVQGDELSLLAPPLISDTPAWLTMRDAQGAAAWSVPRGWGWAEASVWQRHGQTLQGRLIVASDPAFGVSATLNLTSPSGAETVQRLRWIAKGKAAMGTPQGYAARQLGEGAIRTITLSRGYWMADTTCTQGFWRLLMGWDDRREWLDAKVHHPVTGITAAEAELFLQRLSALIEGCDARLPSEAEWEAACRAGTRTAYAFETVGPVQVNAGSRHTVLPVASLPPNAWGLYEMHGNVGELCRDFLGEQQRNSDDWMDPEGAPGAEAGLHAVRGGSFLGSFEQARSAAVDQLDHDQRRDDVGFRFIIRAKPSPEAEPAEPA